MGSICCVCSRCWAVPLPVVMGMVVMVMAMVVVGWLLVLMREELTD